jgi:hypothetical protein
MRAVLFDWNRGIELGFGVTLTRVLPLLNFPVSRWIALIVGAILLFETIRSVGAHFRHVVWAAFLALAVNPVMGFAIFQANHVVFIPALLLITALAWERWSKNRALLTLSLLVLVFIASFVLYYQMISQAMLIHSDLLKILPPVLVLIGLYWMRWWVIRPPRIWADQFGVRK